MSDGKILIMGVGGCGSGFIWNVLRRCGLDTTEYREWMRQSGVRSAIKEGTQLDFPSPKVIKHLGGFLVNLNEHLDTMQWEVEHIFFCVASYELQMHSYKKRSKVEYVEEEVLTKYRRGLGMGLMQIIERDHPFSLVRCPNSIRDPEYCYNKLKCVLGDMPYEEFLQHHQDQISEKHWKRLEKFA
jgi:hypothetical protein